MVVERIFPGFRLIVSKKDVFRCCPQLVRMLADVLFFSGKMLGDNLTITAEPVLRKSAQYADPNKKSRLPKLEPAQKNSATLYN